MRLPPIFSPRGLLLPFLVFLSPLAAAIRIDVPRIQGMAITRPAEAGTFALTVSNPGDTEVTGRLVAALQPLAGGGGETVESDLSLKPGASVVLPVSLAGRDLGVWTVKSRFSPPGGETTTASLRFAVMEPVGPNPTKPAFRFGVVAHHEREADPVVRRREIVAEALVGAKLVRSNPTWGQLQPKPDQWRWALMDEMIDTYESLGLESQVLFAYTPGWAASPEKQKDKSDGGRNITRSAPDRDAWRTYVSTLVTRYKGRVPLWEIWNEPDLGFWRGSVDEYLEIATIALDEIRRIDPAARVMSGGFATLKPHVGRERYNPDLQARVMRALGPRFDYHATHEHGSFESFAQVVDGAYATLRASLPKPVPPLFFNETATHSVGGPDSEKKQAWTLVKKSTFARARGAAGYLWYDLRNDGTDPTDSEHNFGLIERDFQPKPAYVAFNTQARLNIPRPYLGQLDAGTDRWFFVFGDDVAGNAVSSRLLVFWNDDVSAQNEQLLVRAPGATRAALIDVNGNATPLALSDSSVVLSADAEPRYLLVEGATAIEMAGRLAGPRRAYFGAPGQELAVECEFTNPSASPRRVNLRWTSPLSMQVIGEPAGSIQLAPGQKTLAKIVVRLPDGAAYRFGRSARLRLEYDYEGTPYRGDLQIPVQYGSIVIPGDSPGTDRAPDIVLERKEQLHSFIDADPNLIDHRWTGPAAFSARAWLGADAQSLVLRVDVTDTRHHQDEIPTGIWRGDSVQCMLALPGQRGFWEFGFADHDRDGPVTMVWNRPQEALGRQPALGLEVRKSGAGGEGRTYLIRIPRAEVGLTDALLRDGFRFNLAVNDHDGTVRAHALQLAPGLVIGKSSDNLPYVVFRQTPQTGP